MIVGIIKGAGPLCQIGWDTFVGEARTLPYRILPALVRGVCPGGTGNQSLTCQLQIYRLALGIHLICKALALVGLYGGHHLDRGHGVGYPVVQLGIDAQILLSVAGVRPCKETFLLRIHVEDQHGLWHGIRHAALGPPR